STCRRWGARSPRRCRCGGAWCRSFRWLQLIDQGRGRALFCDAARAALACRGERRLYDGAADAEDLRMLDAALAEQFVDRQRALARLQPFLQPRLRVLADAAGRQLEDGALEPRQHGVTT